MINPRRRVRPASPESEGPGEHGNVYRQTGNLLTYPYFSSAERDRRWSLTRHAMDRAGVDCLVVPNNTGHSTHLQADARYLSHVGGGGDADVAVVFPLEGEPAAVATNAARWFRAQPWCTDLREAGRSYGAATLAKLREVRLPRKRIGIVGLRGHIASAEGRASYGFMSTLMAGITDVEWIDFTRELGAIRVVKSREEVSFIEKSMEIVNSTYDAAVAALEPGVKDYAVWGAAIEALCRAGSELPVHQRWIADHHPGRLLARPTFREVEPGWLFLTEIEAAWGGYRAQGAQPFSLGEPAPIYRELMRLEVDLWNETFEALKPGVSLRQLDERFITTARRLTPSAGKLADARCSMVVRGSGLGSDAPTFTGSETSIGDPGRPLAPGWCFVYQPTVRLGDYHIKWGDTVTVTRTGARRLGQAPQRILIAGG